MRAVIVHETDGIFVGQGLGLAFFSMVDCAGQSSVVTFRDTDEALAFLDEWGPAGRGKYGVAEIDVDADYAEIPDLVRAGLADRLGRLLEEAAPAASC